MRTILLIATGGTIASRPTAAGGLAPAITSQELLSCVHVFAEADINFSNPPTRLRDNWHGSEV